MTHYDIIIIGGGLVGLAFACALGDSDFRVAVIDAGLAPLDKPVNDYDLRVSAISLASQRIFQKLHVWSSMEQQRVTAFRAMQVWDAVGNGNIHFDSVMLGLPQLGFIVENRVMLHALYERAQQFSNIHLMYGEVPQNLTSQQDTMLVTLAEQRAYKTSLVVAADGAHSWVRAQTAIKLETKPYQHTAIVANVRCELPHQFTAWQRFLPTGPLAFLPLAEPYTCSIVWSCVPDKANELLAKNDDEFLLALSNAFAGRLGKVLSSSKRMSFPLLMRHAEHYVTDHVALLGDAAHTIHPLAGQGFNLGLLDAACLAEVVLTTRARQRKLFTEHNLRRYQRWRRGHNQHMISMMQLFKQTFADERAFVVWARNLGLTVSNNIMPLKRFFMQHATGLVGDLPELAKL